MSTYSNAHAKIKNKIFYVRLPGTWFIWDIIQNDFWNSTIWLTFHLLGSKIPGFDLIMPDFSNSIKFSVKLFHLNENVNSFSLILQVYIYIPILRLCYFPYIYPYNMFHTQFIPLLDVKIPRESVLIKYLIFNKSNLFCVCSSNFWSARMKIQKRSLDAINTFYNVVKKKVNIQSG